MLVACFGGVDCVLAVQSPSLSAFSVSGTQVDPLYPQTPCFPSFWTTVCTPAIFTSEISESWYTLLNASPPFEISSAACGLLVLRPKPEVEFT